MIRVELLHIVVTGKGVRLPESGEAGFSVQGHAGLQKKGNDIVCAAVSILAQTAVLALENIAGIRQDIKQEEGVLSSIFQCDSIEDEERKAIEVILYTTLLGLMEMRKQYPERLQLVW